MSTDLECYRGEDVEIDYTHLTATDDLTTWALTFEVRTAWSAAVLVTKSVGSGVTVTGPLAATIVLASADLDQTPKKSYVYAFSRRTPGARAVLAEGAFTIKPPRAA